MIHSLKKTMPILLVSAGLLFLPLTASAKTSKVDKEFQKALTEFKAMYSEVLAEDGIVGSSFRFIHDNEVIGKAFYGLANREENRPVDENTIFHWASITKTFCGIAIMQLRDRGLLSLDDPITKYIPELRLVHNPFGSMDEITIRHLMTHTAGFRGASWPYDDFIQPRPSWYPHEPLHWEQLVAMFPYTQIMFEPGTKWSYSNPAIIFLGRVIEILTTDDWETYIDKNIFKPLEMHRSYFDHTPYFLKKDKSQSYWIDKDGNYIPADPDVNTGVTVPNGGLKCPLGDFVNYIDFLMGDSEKQELYDIVLKRSTLEEMWTPFIENSYDPRAEIKGFMGLTFFLQERDGVRLVWHSGGQNAYASYFFVHPESKTAYVVAYNSVDQRRSKPKSETAIGKINEFVQTKMMPIFFKK